MFMEVGFNHGNPIDWSFFNIHIAGRHNPDIMRDCFPDWPEDKQTEFYMEKEARYRYGRRREEMISSRTTPPIHETFSPRTTTPPILPFPRIPPTFPPGPASVTA